MPFFGGGSYEVTLVGVQGTEVCYTKFDYGLEAGDPIVSAQLIAEAFEANILAAWRGLVTQDFTFEEIRVVGSYTAGNYTLPLGGAAGLFLGNSSPPFLTASFRKLVEIPGDQEGTDPEPITGGKFGISGVPQSIHDNGHVNDTAWVTDANAFAFALVTLEDVDGVGTDAHLVIERLNPAGGAPLKLAQVIDCRFNKLGTNNFRKR